MRIVRFTNVLVAGMAFWVIPVTSFSQDAAFKGWVGELASEDFKARVQAQDKILEWANANPAKSKDLLLREYEAAKDPEVQLRLRESLKTVVIGDHQAKNAAGYLGITMEDVNGGIPVPNPKPGVLVKAVQPGSPAQQAGIRNNDVILAMDKTRWSGPEAREALIAEVKKLRPGTEVNLEVLRGAETLKLPLKLGARPMGLPDNQARFINGFIPAGPDFEMLERMEQEAREAFFKDWLERTRKKPAAP